MVLRRRAANGAVSSPSASAGTSPVRQAILAVPDSLGCPQWTYALTPRRRPGRRTDRLLDLSRRPEYTRAIVRRGRPHAPAPRVVKAASPY